MLSSLSRRNGFSIADSRIAMEEERIAAAYARRTQDRHRYSCFDIANLMILQERERRILSALARCGFSDLERRTLLEVGCGSGYWLRQFIQWGARPARVAGIELLTERAEEARGSLPVNAAVTAGSAANLPFESNTFDIVLASVVFSSILDELTRLTIASEMLRVSKSDGLILWYDFHVNNPANPDVRGIRKREIYELFPGCRIRLERLTLAPPLARAVTPISPALYRFLAAFRPLCTHYLGVITKQRPNA